MFDWKQQILDKIGTGIIVLDSSQCVVYWNKEMERLSKIAEHSAIGMKITELCPKLAQGTYQSILENVFSTGQSRFCSGALHKYFILPQCVGDSDGIRQNMKVEPIWNGEKVEFAFLHIADITEHLQNERKLKELNEKLSRGYKSIKASEQAAKKMARYDHLTGALNRGALKSEVEKIIKHLEEKHRKLALLFIDLDNFKQVNDTYGHIIGDALLQHVTGRLLNNTRQGHHRPYDIIARVGGDEFVVALPYIKDLSGIVSLVNKIMNLFRKPFFIGDDRLCVSASIGIAVYPDDSESIDCLIDMADKAMYRVKQSGKNNHKFYECVSAANISRS